MAKLIITLLMYLFPFIYLRRLKQHIRHRHSNHNFQCAQYSKNNPFRHRYNNTHTSILLSQVQILS